MKREYQFDFSSNPAGQYDILGRERKAKTMVAVLEDCIKKPLKELCLLNVGGSSGIIDNYLADYFRSVVSIDIDESAIEKAIRKFQKNNIDFKVGDALDLEFSDNMFDVVICSQVYEHVPSAEKMMDEIFRVLGKRQ
ncbi:MAG: class I SAM-dependent methyltransferase [gamma proteobacterium symbiont of Bathyaustriella thionipta]|nr:class I SAM-dependent methyltransferase [gamma proteobacterium symbiont of Bathyaustriella thionipta]